MRQLLRPARTNAKPASWITKPLLRLFILVAGSVLVGMGLAPSAIATIGPKAPDLKVTHAKFVGPAYAFKNETVRLGFKDETTMNEGDATARKSLTGMFLVSINRSGAEQQARLASSTREVPRLKPNHWSGKGSASASYSMKSVPLGAYAVKVCADVNETSGELDKRNNCKEVGHFYVIKRVWTGAAPVSVHGVGLVGSAADAEKWKGKGDLSFGEYLGDGVFGYDYSGTGSWTDKGTTTYGCAISGAGAKNFEKAPGIDLDYLNGTYSGVVRTPSFYKYSSGPGGNPFCPSDTYNGPYTREFLKIGGHHKLEFGQTALTGTFSESQVTWKWDFN